MRSSRRVPTTSFSISADNRAALIIAAPLAAAVTAEAPGVGIHIRRAARSTSPNGWIGASWTWLWAGFPAPASASRTCCCSRMDSPPWVRHGHPAAARRQAQPRTPRRPTLTFHCRPPGNRPASWTKPWRKKDCRAASRSAARSSQPPAMLAQSDMIAVMSERGAREFYPLRPARGAAAPVRDASALHRDAVASPPRRTCLPIVGCAPSCSAFARAL